jgi:hypothetical protein
MIDLAEPLTGPKTRRNIPLNEELCDEDRRTLDDPSISRILITFRRDADTQSFINLTDLDGTMSTFDIDRYLIFVTRENDIAYQIGMNDDDLTTCVHLVLGSLLFHLRDAYLDSTLPQLSTQNILALDALLTIVLGDALEGWINLEEDLSKKDSDEPYQWAYLVAVKPRLKN